MSRILLVEDEIHIAEGLMFNLRNVGYDVEMAETAGSALAAIAAARDRGEHFDLLLLDVMLPDRSGLELAQSLRRSGHTEPILILSARDRRGDVVAGLDAGADDYITKPFDLDEVLARIRGALRRQVWERAGQADDSPASPAGDRAVSAADAGSSASADASGSAAAAARASANGALRDGAWRIDFARQAAQPLGDPVAGS
ncbi:MAG: response regulator transcription factor, partial [Acidobacteriota bacterium]